MLPILFPCSRVIFTFESNPLSSGIRSNSDRRCLAANRDSGVPCVLLGGKSLRRAQFLAYIYAVAHCKRFYVGVNELFAGVPMYEQKRRSSFFNNNYYNKNKKIKIIRKKKLTTTHHNNNKKTTQQQQQQQQKTINK